MSSFGLRSLLVAKERFGALTVCDRGSTHILAQEELLMDEHERWGLKYRGIDRRVVERELEEYETSDLVAVPSSFAYRSFTERGISPDRLIKVSYGTDLNVFRPQPKRSDVFRVIFAGQISLRKGIPYLLEAVCDESMPRLELWLIGQVFPDVKQFLARYRGRYRHLGVVPRRRLGEFYSQGSVLVVPSIEEGLALVQAQAMACGLPVVATRNAGADDLFTDGVEGFIVPPRDPNAIRERILRLYANPSECAEMGRAAIRRVAHRGGWDRYGEEMVSAYAGALRSDRVDASTTS
jgi:glycosyltransferase involved in cell wall biosynthesis